VLARFSLASVPWRAGLERIRSAFGTRARRAGRWIVGLGLVVRVRAAGRRAARRVTGLFRR
jgi:hypothetical protein